MILHDYSYRNRAALALHGLVGGPGKQRIVTGVPVAIEMADIRLIIVAGDNERALTPSAIAPLARETECEVLATWVDPMLSGHRFLIDALVKEQGVSRVFTKRVLFRTRAGTSFLVDPRGDGPAIAVGERGIRIAPSLPYRSTPERLLGIAAGQALLQQRIYAGTPYATPRERNFAR